MLIRFGFKLIFLHINLLDYVNVYIYIGYIKCLKKHSTTIEKEMSDLTSLMEEDINPFQITTWHV